MIDLVPVDQAGSLSAPQEDVFCDRQVGTKVLTVVNANAGPQVMIDGIGLLAIER